MARKTSELENKKIDESVCSEVKCDKCGELMEIKDGRFGKYLACLGYPSCKNIQPIVKLTGESTIQNSVCKESELTTKMDIEITLKKLTRAQEIFKASSSEYQTLIRDILKEERNVMYMKRRNEIHQRLYDHVKRVIK